MLDELASAQAHEVHHRLRAKAPVVWVDELDGWLVTGRRAALSVLRRPDAFTVDDPRFTTASVVGRSMLSSDGAEHARQRAAFAPNLANASATESADVEAVARTLVDGLAPRGVAELRRDLAAPLVVRTIVAALGLAGTDDSVVLGWYRSIVDGVDRLSTGRTVAPETVDAVSGLRRCVDGSVDASGILSAAASELDRDELFSNTAVVMFGAIETGEGMIANALWHLLAVPGLKARVADDRKRVPDLIEESLRMEPAAAVVDRYAVTDSDIEGIAIAGGDFVRISLAGANRDPAVFDRPDEFDLDRTNLRQHLAFVQGPHACIGTHLARGQTAAAVNAVLDVLPTVTLDDAQATPPTGLIFRKPRSLAARWTPAVRAG